MILTKDIQLELDQNDDLYGNYTYKGGSVNVGVDIDGNNDNNSVGNLNNGTLNGGANGRFHTKNNRNQQLLKTKSLYDFSKTSSLIKYSFLTEQEQQALNIQKYLSTNHFFIINVDTKYEMLVVLKQVQKQSSLSDDEKLLSFNPYKRSLKGGSKSSKSDGMQQSDSNDMKYLILDIPNLPQQNLTEYYAREYGNPCFVMFDFKVDNPEQIISPFVVCVYEGNNKFKVQSPLRVQSPQTQSPLKNYDTIEEVFQNTPIVLFKHQLEEILNRV